jgi:hypothetical protein
LLVNGVSDYKYAQHFGFTEPEVNDLMRNCLKGDDIENQMKKIKKWYNGYIIGEIRLYNPWSIMCCLNQCAFNKQSILGCHWLESGDPYLLEKSFNDCANLVHKDFVKLMKKGVLSFNFYDFTLNLNDMKKDSRVFWNLCLQTGYLTKVDSYNYRVPNREVMTYFYNNLMSSWIDNNFCKLDLNEFTKELLLSLDNNEKLEKCLNDKLLNKLDATDRNESDFHVLIGGAISIGLLSMKSDSGNMIYRIFSERYMKNDQNEKGIIDNILIPLDENYKNIIIHEYKRVESNKQVINALEEAIWQLYSKQYLTEPLNLIEGGDFKYCKNIITRAIVFYQNINMKWRVSIREYIHTIKMAQDINEIFGTYEDRKYLLKDTKKDKKDARNILLNDTKKEKKDKKDVRNFFLDFNNCKNVFDLINKFQLSNKTSTNIESEYEVESGDSKKRTDDGMDVIIESPKTLPKNDNQIA